MTVRSVKQLRAGNRFWWCDRIVEFVRSQNHKQVPVGHGGSRQIIVEDPNRKLRMLLNYYNDEKVILADDTEEGES